MHFRTCPLCEATCGLAIETSDGQVVKIRGDADDVFSHGFICPKAHGLKALHEDPDRLTTPLVKGPTASSARPRGTRRSRRSTAASRRSCRSTVATRWPHTSATRTPTT